MKKVLMATTALAIVAASASAVDVEMYGQVNKAAVTYDDGRDADTVFVDNAKSNTRFGLKGAQALDNGLTASFLLESSIASNPSNAFVQSTTAGMPATPVVGGTAAGASFTERQARVGLSGGWGGVYLGQQSTAIDSVRDQDLVGVRDLMGADYSNDFGSALNFRSSGAGAMSGFTVMGEGPASTQNRTASIRYDSPIWNGLQGRTSFAQGGDVEVSAFYDGSFNQVKVKGAAGVQLNHDAATTATNRLDTRTDASLSVAHSSGLAGTVAWQRQSLDRKTVNSKSPDAWYAKAGYAWDAYEVAADYGRSSHYGSSTAAEDKMSSFGFGGQYNMGQGVSVGAMYRNYGMERTSSNLDDIGLYALNMRVKF